MARTLNLVSGDSHINEPPDLWQSRVPAKFKDRAPRMERLEKGDAWIMEGSPAPINFGNNVNGGMPPDERSPWVRWEDARKGGAVPAVRLEEQDADGVDAEVLYPTPRVSMSVFVNNKDPEFHVSCIRAYNDWLSEYAGYAPDRLIGIAMIPTVGVDAAVEEMKRALDLPAMRGVLLARYPSGEMFPSPADDAFWAAAHEMNIPVQIHVSLAREPDNDPDRKQSGAHGELRHVDAPLRALELINAGVFDRFPNLNLVIAEVDSSWVPYVKEQFDDRHSRRNPIDKPVIEHNPSYYFDRNIFTTYITDHYAIINRHSIGLSQIMWSSDFPHGGTDWPNSLKTIDKHMAGVPDDERHALLAGNAARVYGLDGA